MEDNNSTVNAGAVNEPVGTETNQDVQTFDDILKNKEYQAEFDRRVQKAITTHDEKMKAINDAEKSEAEKLASMNEKQKLEYQVQKEKEKSENALAELNAYKMKEEAISIASEKGLDVSLLNLIDFKTVTAEKLTEHIDNLSAVFNKAVEKSVNERLKEDTPVTKTGMQGSQPKAIPTIF